MLNLLVCTFLNVSFYAVCQPPTNPVVLQMPNGIWGSSYHDLLGGLEYFSIFEINLTGRPRHAAKHWNNNKKDLTDRSDLTPQVKTHM